MPIQKTISYSSGLDVSYWKISKVDLDKSNKSARIILKGYLDKTKSPVASKSFSVSNALFDQYFSKSAPLNFYAQAYIYIKTLAEFSGAFDVDIE